MLVISDTKSERKPIVLWRLTQHICLQPWLDYMVVCDGLSEVEKWPSYSGTLTSGWGMPAVGSFRKRTFRYAARLFSFFLRRRRQDSYCSRFRRLPRHGKVVENGFFATSKRTPSSAFPEQFRSWPYFKSFLRIFPTVSTLRVALSEERICPLSTQTASASYFRVLRHERPSPQSLRHARPVLPMRRRKIVGDTVESPPLSVWNAGRRQTEWICSGIEVVSFPKGFLLRSPYLYVLRERDSCPLRAARSLLFTVQMKQWQKEPHRAGRFLHFRSPFKTDNKTLQNGRPASASVGELGVRWCMFAGWRSPCKKMSKKEACTPFTWNVLLVRKNAQARPVHALVPLLAEFEHVTDIHYAAYQSLSLSLLKAAQWSSTCQRRKSERRTTNTKAAENFWTSAKARTKTAKANQNGKWNRDEHWSLSKVAALVQRTDTQLRMQPKVDRRSIVLHRAGLRTVWFGFDADTSAARSLNAIKQNQTRSREIKT